MLMFQIQECITAHPDEARAGVSRSTIKKVHSLLNPLSILLTLFQYIEEKHKLTITGLNLSQFNRAISSGAEDGTFALPKGPSGKVKLAAKKSAPSKEVCLYQADFVPNLTCI